jgi:uncharacterized UBP type Zn finger protein
LKEYIIFCLKIFDNQLNKNNNHINLPKSFDISNYFDQDLKNKISSSVFYELISVSFHSGENLDKGHYFTINLNENGEYVRFSDESVKTVDHFREGQTNSTAYIMVFKKKGTLLFNNIHFSFLFFLKNFISW